MEHDTHIPDPHDPPITVPDGEIRRVRVQGVGQHEVLHDRQRGREDPVRQLLVLGVLRVELHREEIGVHGETRVDVYRLRDGRMGDRTVAGRGVHVVVGPGRHLVCHGEVGAVEAGGEDGVVGALVVAPVADGVDVDVGGRAVAAPEVGQVWVRGRLGRTVVYTYVGGSDGAIGQREITNISYDLWDFKFRVWRNDSSLSGNYLRCVAARDIIGRDFGTVSSPAQPLCVNFTVVKWTCKNKS